MAVEQHKCLIFMQVIPLSLQNRRQTAMFVNGTDFAVILPFNALRLIV